MAVAYSMLKEGHDTPDKMNPIERKFKIEHIPDVDVKDHSGKVQNSIFRKGNKISLIMDTQTCLWHFKYTDGMLPPPLKQQFTGFRKALSFGQGYFERRGLKLTEDNG